jgi:Dinucleotide-utilizing enzymes involved in molybdopterin and thiamine biosynthesis family 1
MECQMQFAIIVFCLAWQLLAASAACLTLPRGDVSSPKTTTSIAPTKMTPRFMATEPAHITEDISMRFSSVGRLFHPQQQVGDDQTTNERTTSCSTNSDQHMNIVHKLSKSTVAIFGIGGVGSWAAEAICRSGVGNIILVDLDDICTSNINRQLHALSSTVGEMKIDQMKKRLLDINPHCNVTLIHDFVGQQNADDIIQSLNPNVDVILDAIDGTDEKAALIAAACRNHVTIVTCGGAAGRLDPTRIVCDDLSRSNQCRLLFWVKKQLRDKYKLFSKGSADKNSRIRPWKIWAVYSEEVIIQKQQQQDKGSTAGVSSLRTCDGPLGTACFVTGTYGFVAASKVVTMLAKDELIKPKILKSALFLKPFQETH